MKSGLVWSFAEKCRSAKDAGEVHDLFFHEVAALGFCYAACLSHVDPLNPPRGAVAITNYPKAWLEHFSASGYADRDPVYAFARAQALPFQWTDRDFLLGLTRDQRRILDEAAEIGLENGLTMPLHVRGALPASCSLVAGSDGVDPLNLRPAYWLGVYAHEAARRLSMPRDSVQEKVKLGRRERECLELVGRGKDDYAIGVILGIQQSTAHNTVQRAMTKYGVATRIQAVMRALQDGEIDLGDIAD